jgi:uncharacterized metal-binding protein YceD (DUF177 family)
MTLRISDFVAHPGRRYPVALVLDGGKLEPDALCTVERVELSGDAFAQYGTLFLETTLRAVIVQPCSRCLEPATTELVIEEDFELPIRPGAETVDVLPDVLRLVLSAHDANVLCRPDCRGLCPICGADLNREPDHVCAPEGEERITLRDWLA